MIRIFKKILERYPRFGHFARQIKWQMKKIPLLRRLLIGMDRAYFLGAGKERPHHENYTRDDPYTLSYLTVPLCVSEREHHVSMCYLHLPIKP